MKTSQSMVIPTDPSSARTRLLSPSGSSRAMEVSGRWRSMVLFLAVLFLGSSYVLSPFVLRPHSHQGRWWFSQRRLTRDGILNPTAELFFHYLRDDTDYLSLVSLLAGALEFVPLLAGKKSGSKKERKERQAKIDELEAVLEAKREEQGVEEDPIMKKESQIGVSTAAGKRARALIWAHILRHDLDNEELADEQLSVLLTTPILLNAMLNIALSHNWLKTTKNIIKLQAALVQAVPPCSSPLQQLPGITPEQALELEIVKGVEGQKWAEKALAKDVLSPEAKAVVEVLPRLELVDAEFTVDGEKLVTPGSIVSLDFKLRYRFPTTSSSALTNGAVSESTAVKEEKEERNEVVHEDVAALKEGIKKQNGTATATEKEKEIEEKDRWAPNGYIHAPHWPRLQKPHFRVLLGDTKLDKVIIQPSRITDIPLPLPDGSLSEPRTFSLQFQAPPQANDYSFVLYALSDTFLGSDVSRPIIVSTVSLSPSLIRPSSLVLFGRY